MKYPLIPSHHRTTYIHLLEGGHHMFSHQIRQLEVSLTIDCLPGTPPATSISLRLHNTPVFLVPPQPACPTLTSRILISYTHIAFFQSRNVVSYRCLDVTNLFL